MKKKLRTTGLCVVVTGIAVLACIRLFAAADDRVGEAGRTSDVDGRTMDEVGERLAALEARLAQLDRRVAGAERLGRSSRRAGGDGSAAATGDAAEVLGPGAERLPGDRRVYVSLEAVERLLRTRAGAAAASRGDAVVLPFDEAARAVGLSAEERTAARAIVLAEEEETAGLLLGSGTVEEMRARILNAQTDAARMAELGQTVSDNTFSNFGKLAVARERLREKLAACLGAERAGRFVEHRREPVIDAIVAMYLGVY
ncbi:MAG: hypothetical protein K8T90_09735 [Planctomycetes bacterium]|nr:hypothetical protein [Planctomycetota bacterium]